MNSATVNIYCDPNVKVYRKGKVFTFEQDGTEREFETLKDAARFYGICYSLLREKHVDGEVYNGVRFFRNADFDRELMLKTWKQSWLETECNLGLCQSITAVRLKDGKAYRIRASIKDIAKFFNRSDKTIRDVITRGGAMSGCAVMWTKDYEAMVKRGTLAEYIDCLLKQHKMSEMCIKLNKRRAEIMEDARDDYVSN